MPDGVLDEETLLVLVNALYLKAAWSDPFHESSTTDADFHLADGTVVQVPTMLGHVGAQVGAGDGWRSARLPYVGGTLAMTVVLPDPGRLADVEALVAERDWSAVLDAPSHERLELRLPRFTVRTGARLRELLVALGMPTAFTDDADFSGLTVESSGPQDQRGAARGLRRRRRAGHRGRGRDRRGDAAGRRDAAAAGAVRGRPAVPVRHPRRGDRHAAVRGQAGRSALTPLSVQARRIEGDTPTRERLGALVLCPASLPLIGDL